MKTIFGALFLALLVSPLAFAHVDLPSTPSDLSVEAPTGFFATITPDFLGTNLPPVCTTGLDSNCSSICFAKHEACAVFICGQPCFTEPCLSELSDCLNACG